jgi:hypothetical protein
LLASGKSADPQTFNRYAYTSNNPLSRVDRNGMEWYEHTSTKVSRNYGSRVVTTISWKSGINPHLNKVRGYVHLASSTSDNRVAYRALNPFENEFSTFTSYAAAAAQVQAYRNEAALNFIAGALEAASIAFELSGAASGMGVNKNSEMYAAGAKSGTAASIVAAVTGAGAANLGAKIIGKGLGGAASSVLKGIRLCCFVAGTPIHTDKGLKPIEKIKAGDLVLSWNEQTKKFEYKPVLGTIVGTKENLVKIKVKGERKLITVSTEHPFYVRTVHKARDGLSSGEESDGEAEGEWLEAADLKVGQQFLRPDGTRTRITEIKREHRPVAVYNFEVADNHNYFVGEIGLLVHNSCTGTVWDAIKATQPLYKGSLIPRSFELTTGNGRFWVHGNATEHFAEYAAGRAVNGTPEAVRMATQAHLTSFQTAVNAAAQQGITYGQMMNVGGWELVFQPARQAGQLPTITHAFFTGR